MSIDSTAQTEQAEQTDPLSEASARRKDLAVSVVTLLAGAAIIAHLTRYNRSTWLGEEYLLVNATFLLFVPFLFIFILFRERAEQFGFRPPERGAGRIAALFFVLMLPILAIASRYPAFHNYYPMRPQAESSLHFLLYWELTYGLYMFCWEFFYRGFLTFGLKRAFGPLTAVLLQTVGFGLMHWGKPTPEFFGSFAAGLALGGLALRGKSFVPCFAVHWAVSITFDLLAIHARPGGIF
jgi:uncharacterized protein